jgi:flagellar protein FlgJ
LSPDAKTLAARVAQRSRVDPRMVEAAQGMEAMFLDYMMKVMRETVPKNEMDLESPATQVYRSMLDSEYAQRAARAGGVGLADQIIAYWDPQRYTLDKISPHPGTQGHAVPVAQSGRVTGGSDEGQSNGQ